MPRRFWLYLSLLGAITLGAALLPGSAGAAPTAPLTGTSNDGALNCLQKTGLTAHCISPQELRQAYGVDSLIRAGNDGTGQTIVLPEAAAPHSQAEAEGLTDIHRDLDTFDQRFGLRPANISITTAPGVQPPTLATSEEVLDVEMVHSIAPGAAIRIYRTADNIGGKGEAIAAAVKLGDIVTISYGRGETCPSGSDLQAEGAALQQAVDSHVTVLAASGDLGATTRPCQEGQTPAGRGVSVPASDPRVLAVGGTTLYTDPNTGNYQHETVWNTGEASSSGAPPNSAAGASSFSGASGGGFSQLFSTPSYQQGVLGAATQRGVPDVAADAAALTGFPRVTIRHGRVSLTEVIGTSASTPMWAGIVALANQRAGHRLGFINPAIYRIAQSPSYGQAFHDVTEGTNTFKVTNGPTIDGYQAGAGWDPATGWGSPNAAVLVPLLAQSG